MANILKFGCGCLEDIMLHIVISGGTCATPLPPYRPMNTPSHALSITHKGIAAVHKNITIIMRRTRASFVRSYHIIIIFNMSEHHTINLECHTLSKQRHHWSCSVTVLNGTHKHILDNEMGDCCCVAERK